MRVVRTKGRFGRRFIQLNIGLMIFGFGLAALIQADLGAAPWDVLAQGLGRKTDLSFGIMTILLGIVVLLLWIPLRERMGIGTVLNVLLIGVFADIGIALFPAPDVLWMRVAMLTAGLLLIGLASGLYIGAGLGPGPRDGLMTGLHRVTGRPIWAVRTVIELTVLALGWLLGGTVGFGTLAIAVLIGPLCQLFLRVFTIKDIAPAVVAS